MDLETLEGGTAGHGSPQYGRGVNGNTTPNAQNGQSGNAGFVYIFEYIELDVAW